MAFTAGFSVNVGDPTKATDVTTLAANDDFLKTAIDKIMVDSATPTFALVDGVTATTQSASDNSTKLATTAYADAAGASLTGSTNNTVVTVTGANALAGEANLTFDGSTLAVTGAADVSGDFTAGTVNADSDTAASDSAAMGYTEAEGLILTGQGSTNDVTIKNDADGTVLEIATGGTDVEVTSGNLIIGTSGKGIDFAATADAAGMTSEVLDDYEEGTWTATITFGGNAVGVGYTEQTMFYTKIGNVVTISGIFGLSSKGSSTGYATVWGLPFTSDSAAGAYAGTAMYLNNVSFADVPLQIIHVNSTRIGLEEISNAGGRSDLTDGNFADNGEMIVNLTYRAA